MGHYNVRYEDKWACLSTIVESLITPFMSIEEYEKWRKEEYGRANYKPMQERNTIDIKEAIESMCLNHTHKHVINTLIDCGLDEETSKRLISEYGMYTEKG